MRYIILIISTCLPAFAVDSQELLRNPGYEEVIGCPGPSVSLSNVVGWDRIGNHFGTPDQYYGDCDYNGLDNPMAPGQRPFDGVGYVGGFCFGSDLREYITTELIEPMIKDSVYQLSFYVLPAAGYGQAIDSYGVHFSLDAPRGVASNSLAPLLLEEHIGNPSGELIDDTVRWKKISGTYKAKGGERFATFGNFRPDNATQHECIKKRCIRSDRSYILLDGASLNFKNEEPIAFQDRALVSKHSFTTTKEKVEVYLWDEMQVDHDTVTVFIHNELIASDIPLLRKKHKIQMRLEKGKHQLAIHAVNLGDIPPNTISVLIKSGRNRVFYTLHSDLKETECLTIIVE